MLVQDYEGVAGFGESVAQAVSGRPDWNGRAGDGNRKPGEQRFFSSIRGKKPMGLPFPKGPTLPILLLAKTSLSAGLSYEGGNASPLDRACRGLIRFCERRNPSVLGFFLRRPNKIGQLQNPRKVTVESESRIPEKQQPGWICASKLLRAKMESMFRHAAAFVIRKRATILQPGMVVLAGLALLSGAAAASYPAKSDQGAVAAGASMPPRELVQKVIANEMKAAESTGHYMYRLRKTTPKGVQVKDMIETRDLVLGRLVSINDQPLTAEQRQADDNQIQKLISNPGELRRKKRQEQEDADRASKMLKALPDAFIYESDGNEPGAHGNLVRLKFRPNPNFNPPSRETMVYRGMTGHMLVDAAVLRMAKIDATLVQDVNFGWGILGHLDRGGKFIVEQRDVGNGRWETTQMTLDFVGKAIFGLKNIRIKETEITTDFRRVPDDLTLAQGLEILKQQEQVVAKKQTGR